MREITLPSLPLYLHVVGCRLCKIRARRHFSLHTLCADGNYPLTGRFRKAILDQIQKLQLCAAPPDVQLNKPSEVAVPP